MQRRSWSLGAATLCVAAAIALTGCCSTVVPEDGVSGGDGAATSTVEATQPVTPPPATAKTVIVPDVLGMYYDDAAAALKEVGLEPVEMSIHGPIDEDAGEIGGIYRQTPKAGESVPPGTAIELRYWWESQ
jgi:hypothetical protein